MVDAGTSVKMETDWRRRFDAGIEAIELLDRAGFNVHDFGIEEEAADAQFEINATLSVGQLTRPLDALEEEEDEVEVGEGFALGFTAALLAANPGQCDRDDCPR